MLPLIACLCGYRALRGGVGEPQKPENMTVIEREPLRVFLSSWLEYTKELPKADVECKLGKVPCDGVVGTLGGTTVGRVALPFRLALPLLGVEVRCELENRLHPDAPFGIVTSKVSLTFTSTPSTRDVSAPPGERWLLKQIDFGQDATTELPDAK